MNRKIIEDLVNQDYDSIQNKIGNFLKDEIEKRRSSGLVFGLSGGIDSAVIASLCAKFVKEKSLALIMPNAKITPSSETEDAIKIVDKYSIEYKLIDIGFIHGFYHFVFLFFRIRIAYGLARLDFIQRRLGNVNIPRFHNGFEITVKQG